MSATDTGVFRDAVRRGTATLDVAGVAGTYTVPVEAAKAETLRFTGALGASFAIALPAVAGMDWILDLQSVTSASGQVAVFVGAGATGVYVPLGYTHHVVVPPAGTGVRHVTGAVGLSGGASVVVASAATDTLTAAESKAAVIELTGGDQATEITLSSDQLGPGNLTPFVVSNARAHASTLKAPDDEGSGVTIAAASRAILMIDGSGDMVRVTADEAA